jgi:glycosyltransferase involved in cell wall biosynthesis
MTASPRVTVLLAVHNGGAYLREAVDSVLAQTFGDFELLIVDDASTDDALESLPADPRIRVLRNDRNLGQIASLNRGLQSALGTYVARLDHDDVCLPQRLGRQVDLLDRMPDVALGATWVDIVDNQGGVWAQVRTRIDSFADFASRVVAGRLVLVHPSLIFRRDVVVELGGFDERLNAAEDQELYRRLVLAGHDARVVPEVLLHYRRHDDQMTVAKATRVRESDSVSYERFLAALAPELPAKTLRLVLDADPQFWDGDPPDGDLLERFLTAARTRLRLDAAGTALLAEEVARRASACLLAGWAAGAYDRRGRPLAAFALHRGTRSAQSVAALQPVLAATAPAGRPIAAARTMLRVLLRSAPMSRPRRLARRSRALRRIYARAVDTRSVGD